MAAAAILHVEHAAMVGLGIGIDAVPDRDAGLGTGDAQSQSQDATYENSVWPHDRTSRRNRSSWSHLASDVNGAAPPRGKKRVAMTIIPPQTGRAGKRTRGANHDEDTLQEGWLPQGRRAPAFSPDRPGKRPGAGADSGRY